LLDAGVSRHIVARRAKTGNLHRIHRGVYVAGHMALAPMALETAALLACGAGAVISHRSAAHLWKLIDRRPIDVDVTLIGRRCRPKKGVKAHHAKRLHPRDIRRMSGVVLTSPARTLIDCAADADDGEFERAVSEARALRLITDRDLEGALERAGHRRGTAKVRAFLRGESEQGFTRSEAERRMRWMTKAAGLPQPICNAPLQGYSVDFLWPDHRLVIEVDGFQFHGHRSAFERDRRKDQALTAAGYTVMRITWRQLRYEPLRVAAVVATALTARRPPG